MSPARSHRFIPRLEPLEERLTPVIDGTMVASNEFTGVVALRRPGGPVSATGALLWTGQHVITAAHIFDDDGDRKVDEGKENWQVVFKLPSGRLERHAIPVTVTDQNLWLPALWNKNSPFYPPGAWSALRGGDVAVITLPYQAPLEDKAAGFVGAERYDVFADGWGGDFHEIVRRDDGRLVVRGREFQFVGYGMTGIGNKGWQKAPSETRWLIRNRFDGDPTFNPLHDEVQVVSIDASRRSRFRLVYRDPLGTQRTRRLAWNASALDMKRAFEDLARLVPGDVRVTRLDHTPAGKPKQRSWFIHFTSFYPHHKIGGTDIPQLKAEPAAGVSISTALQGGRSTRLPVLLTYDFDNGKRENDAMGLLFGFNDTGVPGEGMPYVGDSGGPAFLTNAAGKRVIAAIQSGVGPQNRNIRPPDIDNKPSPSQPGKKPVPVNGSFGEIGYMTRLNQSHGGIGLPEFEYEWVLDLNHQPWGDDGKDDEIKVRRVGNVFEVTINGEKITIKESVTALRIIGSPDNELVEIEHPRIAGLEISTDLRRGEDKVTVTRLPRPGMDKPIQVLVNDPETDDQDRDTVNIFANRGDVGAASFTLAGALKLVNYPDLGESDDVVIFGDDADNDYNLTESLEFAVRIHAENGDDVFRFGEAFDSRYTIINAGEGVNTLDYSAFTSGVTVDLLKGQASRLNSLIGAITTVLGGAGDDVLIGDNLANTLRGNKGNDHLRGEGGNDILIDPWGVNILDGGLDNDVLDAVDSLDEPGRTPDTMIRGGGTDTVRKDIDDIVH